MKNPNGYGSVVKLSGNRRKPFVVRKTTGFNEKGHPIYMVIGYYKTREEGMKALADYNHDPYDVDQAAITLDQLHELWVEKKLSKMAGSTQKNLKSSWNYISKLKDMKYREIKAAHMQECIDSYPYGASGKGTMRALWKHLDNFAIELDIPIKRYADLVHAPSYETENERVPFTDAEIETIWKQEPGFDRDTILILLYTGWRITEFRNLLIEDVNLEEGTIKGGVKTNAGKNRVVPIHSKIRPLIEEFYDKDQKYLIRYEDGKQISDGSYRNEHFKPFLSRLGFDHTPHDARHTVRTKLDEKKANKKCVDMILGHKTKDVGLRVYTHKTIQDLKDTIELIDY